MAEEILSISHLMKRFGDQTVLKDISLGVREGEVIVVIGPSGCGKSTFLRCINALEEIQGGEIRLKDDVISRNYKNLAEIRQKIGMVFQNYELFPHLNVLDNIILAPTKVQGRTKEDAKEEALKLLSRVGLSDKAESFPRQLSGGQKQRVAIARALATNPRYLLCDEATSALDPNTTRSILELLEQINRTMGVTIVIITHEMKVIDQICDRVAVLDHSRIAEEGKVSDVFTNPRSPIARELILPGNRSSLMEHGGRRVRLTFRAETSQQPVISQMVLDCGCPVNILYADMKELDSEMYGQMLLELPPSERDAEKVISWLKNSPLEWQEEVQPCFPKCS